jgi:hypothetical protein
VNGERDGKEGVSRIFGGMISEKVRVHCSKDGEGQGKSKEVY